MRVKIKSLDEINKQQHDTFLFIKTIDNGRNQMERYKNEHPKEWYCGKIIDANIKSNSILYDGWWWASDWFTVIDIMME